MKFVLFYHSLISDWNHGNAHFLRGVVGELLRCGHDVRVLEPANGWSVANLVADHGTGPVRRFHRLYPGLRSEFYRPGGLDVARLLDDADAVIVHEWTEPDLVARIARHRRSHGGYRLLFHDTHHRAVTRPESLPRAALEEFDAVLAFGRSLADVYEARGWARRVRVWHEAADHRRFRPRAVTPRGDVVWIGNWGDGERTEELQEFLVEPISRLGLSAHVHGVRYPAEGRRTLARAGITYGGWLPNYEVPETLGAFRATIHVPRRPYLDALPGIPTIRMFEALACGIPIVAARWRDTEGLFHEGEDHLRARDGREMTAHLRSLARRPELSARLAARGRRTIETRHTCAHRVLELSGILEELGAGSIVTARRTTPRAAGAAGAGRGGALR